MSQFLHRPFQCAVMFRAARKSILRRLLSNPAQRADLGKAKKYRPAYYEEEQVYDMLAALEGEPLRYRALVYLAIDTGMRSSEITGLVWSDINLERGIISVSKQRQYVSSHGTIERDPKTESGLRTITLSGTAAELLRQYGVQQKVDMLGHGTAWKGDRHVFLHEDGAPMHPHRPYKWFTAFLERHNLPKLTFHQLCHTNASLLIADGVDVVTLSGRLGHGDKNVTLNTYGHIIKSQEAQAANRMEKFYSRPVKNA